LFRELLPVAVAGLVPFAVLVLIITGTAFSLVAWQPPIVQTIQFGTASSENGVTAISSDQTGLYLAGFVGYSFGGFSNLTPSYLFVNRYDPNGREIWTQRFGNPSSSWVYGISAGTDGVYVVGYPNETFSFVRKYGFDGTQSWDDKFGNWSARTVSANPTGVYVAGENSTEYIVRAYALNGTLIWSRFLGNPIDNVYVYSNPSGVYVIAEQALGTSGGNGSSLVARYTLNGTLVWTRSCYCEATGISTDSSAIYAAGTVQTLGGRSAGLLAKYGLSGDQLWNTTFNAPGFNSVESVQLSADPSGIYLAETTSDGKGINMKYDTNGRQVWSVKLPWQTGVILNGLRYDVIALGESSVYTGGSMRASTDVAFLTILDKSSSLIFFGVNPPFSFVLVALLLAICGISILWFRRQWVKRHMCPGVRGRYRSQRGPAFIAYDGLGRLSVNERFLGTSTYNQSYTYNWQDRVMTETDQLGLLVRSSGAIRRRL